jgi:hypothetical protein
MVQILLAAVMLGLLGGYGWSAMTPHPIARPHLPKPTALAQPEAPDSPSDEQWAARAAERNAPTMESSAPDPTAVEHSVYYSGCNEVRAAGKAPLYADQSGYRPEMDGDNDGIACEPYRGR